MNCPKDLIGRKVKINYEKSTPTGIISSYNSSTLMHKICFPKERKWANVRLDHATHVLLDRRRTRSPGVNIGDIVKYDYEGSDVTNNRKTYLVMVIAFYDQKDEVYISYINSDYIDIIPNKFNIKDIVCYSPQEFPQILPKLNDIACTCKSSSKTDIISIDLTKEVLKETTKISQPTPIIELERNDDIANIQNSVKTPRYIQDGFKCRKKWLNSQRALRKKKKNKK